MKKQKHSFRSFKELKHGIQKARFPLADAVSPRDKTDDEVFRDAMADVREIREFRRIPFRKPPKIQPRTPKPDDALEMLAASAATSVLISKLPRAPRSSHRGPVASPASTGRPESTANASRSSTSTEPMPAFSTFTASRPRSSAAPESRPAPPSAP